MKPLTVNQLTAKLARACAERDEIERRQDAIWVEWTLLQADVAILDRKLEAFAKAVPGCLKHSKGQ